MLFEWFIKGGPLMWPLLACSVIGLTIIIERYLVFRPILQKVKNPERKKLLSKYASYPDIHPVWQMYEVFQKYSDINEQIRDNALQREGNNILKHYRKNLGILLSISNLSPLIGLLGTVLGLVKTFQSMNQLAQAPATELIAGGMWEALLTTVAGLMIGIPCLVAYQCYSAITDNISGEMEEAISLLTEQDAISGESERLSREAYAN
jgi:biopolymer transport protein ExbB